MKKNGLNVEHFRYHITIRYDKSSSASIDWSNYQRKKMRPNYVLVRPTEKNVAKEQPVRRMSLESLMQNL